MESFSEERFPTDISYGVSGGPSFQTDIVTTSSGHEYRNICNLRPRYKYQLASAIKTETQLSELMSFFKAMKGRAVGFRFKDWLDYRVSNQQLAVADGKSDCFQLEKIYRTGEIETKRKITKPVKNSVVVFVNGLEETEVDIDYRAGIIKFQSPPKEGSSISASFEFDIPVRFDNDAIVTTMQSYGVQLIEDITLIEVYQ